MRDNEFHIDTPRLTLSHYNPALDSHCDHLLELHHTPEVRIANEGARPFLADREAARESIESNNDRIVSTGYGRYLVCLKTPPLDSEASKGRDASPFSERVETYQKIGTVSMKTQRNAGAPSVPDIGFSFFPAFWGKGYATEASVALMEHFEKVRGQTEYLGYCNPNNENSKAMFRRLGFEERGVRTVIGILPDGKALNPLVWSKGLKRSLEECGIGDLQ